MQLAGFERLFQDARTVYPMLQEQILKGRRLQREEKCVKKAISGT